jgi:hypothetical protein
MSVRIDQKRETLDLLNDYFIVHEEEANSSHETCTKLLKLKSQSLPPN